MAVRYITYMVNTPCPPNLHDVDAKSRLPFPITLFPNCTGSPSCCLQRLVHEPSSGDPQYLQLQSSLVRKSIRCDRRTLAARYYRARQDNGTRIHEPRLGSRFWAESLRYKRSIDAGNGFASQRMSDVRDSRANFVQSADLSNSNIKFQLTRGSILWHSTNNSPHA